MAQRAYSTRPLHLNDLLGLLPWVPSGPVCDLGSGSGELAAALAAYGLPVTGLDVDRAQLQLARQRYGTGIDWVEGDLRSWRFQRESYAGIFCLDLFPFIPNGERARLIGRLKAALRPGGLIAISGLDEADPAADSRLARSANRVSVLPTGVFGARELDERFRDWEVLYRYRGPAPLSWLRTGQPHLIDQIIARKPWEARRPDWSALPRLGAGLSWPVGEPREAGPGSPDFIELGVDRLLEPEDDSLLARLATRFRLLPQSRTLSLGTPGPLQGQVEALARVVARCGGPWWCEQLGYSRADQTESYALQPLPATEEALELVKGRIRELRGRIPLPLLLEALPAMPDFAHADMDQPTFLRHVAEEADCGLVIDAARLASLGDEALGWLGRLPRERVLQLRLGLANLPPGSDVAAIWELARAIAARCPLRAVSLDLPPAAAPLQAELLERSRGLTGGPA